MEQQEFLSPQLQSFFEAESATVGQRLLNYLVDVVILYIAALGLGIMLAIATYVSGEPNDPGGFFQELLLIIIIYSPLLCVCRRRIKRKIGWKINYAHKSGKG